MHRTANGKTIDMNALRTKNEHVRAVGNMNVNARGDIIDSENRVINDNNKRMNAMYNKTTANPPVPYNLSTTSFLIAQKLGVFLSLFLGVVILPKWSIALLP